MEPLIKLVQDVYKKVTTIQNGLVPSFAAFVGVAAANILAGLLNQLLDNIVNAVCSASDQIYGFLRSGLTDGICLKNPGKGLNPFNFGQLDLEPFKCAGFSVDLLNGGLKGTVIEGLDVNLNNLGAQAAQSKAALESRRAAQAAQAAAEAAKQNNVVGTPGEPIDLRPPPAQSIYPESAPFDESLFGNPLGGGP
jgi:hypothetical protein